ncbi:SAM-dependent methyltransferase [Actinomycetospora endophytica]|uniref:S-adenosyl-L-methionine-dependent methyltransferase n=1 Tax=Actinomycetospora endophytica TaxID=2291215 RepID=A0ABS8P596_9PSEU|nr:SAM-dependent methyltransferase [Actinomycetospora endophytica]MCD2192710.1 SAM-dependent methyltransferase [Actinomycetospora endophytica]
MREGEQSRTAEYMALFRALETRRPPGRRLFADPLAAAFLSSPLAQVAGAARLPGLRGVLPWVIDRRFPGPRPSAVARTKVLDDAVAAADGIEQLVILGAGYDSRPYRLSGCAHVRVFEVDHPDTQAVKRRVLARVLGQLPAHVHFVAVDFDHDDLAEALDRAGFRTGRPTFVLWEGVASYLTPEAVDATVRWAHDATGTPSELAFTYVHRGLIDGTVQFPHADAWVRSVADAGEPFVFGFEPAELPAYLDDRGWSWLEDISTTEALIRYGLDPRAVPAFYRIARARH